LLFTEELTILSKFQDNRAKSVDFSLIAYFWDSQKYYASPSITRFFGHFDGIYEKSGTKSIKQKLPLFEILRI
jgi:hypothetical protein